jgi:hypothetical protein
MAARDGSPGMSGEAKRPAFSRRPLLLGLSLLATVAFFEAVPTPAQSLNLFPFHLSLGGGGYRHHRHYYRHHGGYHRRHHFHRYGHRHLHRYGHRYHGGGHRHHRGGHRGGGGGGHAPIAPL